MFIPITSTSRIEWTPPSMADEKADPETLPRIILRQPTAMERDQLTARMISLGLTAVTDTQIRAVMIDDLYNIMKEAEADDNANFLDDFWQRQALHEEHLDQWMRQETERVWDIKEGAPEIPPTQRPKAIISPRENARAVLLVERMQNESVRVQAALAERIDYHRKNAVLLCRIGIAGVVNIPALNGCLTFVDDVMTEQSLRALRDAISQTAFAEITNRCDQMYRLEDYERGNSDLPLVKPSAESGLDEASGASAQTDGPLMGLNTEQALSAESGQTTAPLSSITSAPEGQTSSPGQMVAE